MNADERRLNEMIGRIIGCIYSVANELGCGFLEKVYESAVLVKCTSAEGFDDVHMAQCLNYLRATA